MKIDSPGISQYKDGEQDDCSFDWLLYVLQYMDPASSCLIEATRTF